MKELSIEKKAKAYDETIEKLREFYRDYDTVSHLIDVKEELANRFPELKESEDEKIRKTLMEFFVDWGKSRSHFWSISIPKVLIWLEKQGEQKPAWKPSGEQMEFLWKYAEQNNYDGRILTSLYQDLKKLREE